MIFLPVLTEDYLLSDEEVGIFFLRFSGPELREDIEVQMGFPLSTSETKMIETAFDYLMDEGHLPPDGGVLQVSIELAGRESDVSY